MKSKIKKVLIISVRAGAGHIKTAEAIEKEIKRLSSRHVSNKQSVEVRNIDFLDYSNILSKTDFGTPVPLSFTIISAKSFLMEVVTNNSG